MENNQQTTPEIPLGLGMALTQNPESLNYFSSLSQERQQQIIEHTHQIRSTDEMRAYVDSLSNWSENQ